jgi:hypothetical protein
MSHPRNGERKSLSSISSSSLRFWDDFLEVRGRKRKPLRKKKGEEHAEGVQEGVLFPFQAVVRVSAVGKKT